jgi:hypothetical protein
MFDGIPMYLIYMICVIGFVKDDVLPIKRRCQKSVGNGFGRIVPEGHPPGQASVKYLVRLLQFKLWIAAQLGESLEPKKISRT